MTVPRIFLIYNPHSVVDKDIWLSAQNGGFQARSWEIEIAKTAEGHTVERLDLLAVAKSIISFEPDLVLTINGAGLDNDRLFAYFCAYMQIPLVIWYVDEPFIILDWGLKFFPENTIAFTFDRFYERRLREWGIPWVYTLPLGANHDRMLGYVAPGKDRRRYSDNVSFVGSLGYNKIEYLLRNISLSWKTMPPGMDDVLGEAINEYRFNHKRDTEEVVRQCADAMGVEFKFPNGIVRQMVLSFIDREASFRLRREIVGKLKPFGISVYGEKFWEKMVGEGTYRGAINYYSGEIAHLYRSSRINLNISKYQLKTTGNQRVFDCPLCDGFLITDYREDLEEYFDLDKSIVTFRNFEELASKIAFYLANENKAREIAEDAKDTVLRRHTYHHRLEEMCSVVSKIKADGGIGNMCKRALERKSPPRFDLLIRAIKEGENAGRKTVG